VRFLNAKGSNRVILFNAKCGRRRKMEHHKGGSQNLASKSVAGPGDWLSKLTGHLSSNILQPSVLSNQPLAETEGISEKSWRT
jgi:hypothetical protein